MDIREIKGVGDKTAALLSKLGVNTVEDLIDYYPRDYELYKMPTLIKDIVYADMGQVIAIDCVVYNKPNIARYGKKSVVSCIVKDKLGDGIKCVWFNMPYIVSSLKKGMRYVIRGRLGSNADSYVLEQPKIYSLDEYDELQGKLKPIYPLTKGLSNNAITKAVKNALNMIGHGYKKEFLNSEIRNRFDLVDTFAAISALHFPDDLDELSKSRNRVIFDEFLLFMLAMQHQKRFNAQVGSSYIINESDVTNSVLSSLPYELTDSQKDAIRSIREDLALSKPMNRLLHGDVGSGKTIVAFTALLDTVFSGYQGALMAPTEVLATQEYIQLDKLIKDNNLDINIALLTSATKLQDKKRIYEGLASGDIDIAIGTHALIQERVKYKNLALAITDEQHRFGVNQRKKLRTKGADGDKSCNVLVMSATPIPRTLAWIIYGDLDISTMKVMPKGRLHIKNAIIDSSYMPNVYSFVEKHINAGRQVYIICPMIEQSEQISAADVYTVAEDFRTHMSGSAKIDILHGKMSPTEKTDIMGRFSNGETNVLVSTTVVEVGVNVPNATIMLIYNADRFGLSALHQLRGRVGRGEHQSYCMFLSDVKSDSAKERLNVISSTNDGFKIAEDDLKLRGPGDFFGVRQSGEVLFSMADPNRDGAILENVKVYVEELEEVDAELEKDEHEGIRNRLRAYLEYRDELLNL